MDKHATARPGNLLAGTRSSRCAGDRMHTVVALPTVEELQAHVHETLCKHDKLDPLQTPLERAIIERRGKPCGLFFEVTGPRRVRMYAVWAGAEDRILFYDASGVRFAE